jgi:hypothetical protein
MITFTIHSRNMREKYLDVAIKMGELGASHLRSTHRHSRQFLRGVTDFDADGNYAWKKGKFANKSYQFSENAYPHRNLKNYSGVLYGEHVIPLKLVFERWLEMVENSDSAEDQRRFLDEHLIVVWITIEEQQRVDRELKLRIEMPDGWTWSDDVYARLIVAGIRIHN